MGCGGSKAAREQRREADAYARRKKNGFKDEGLENFRKDAVKQKKRLHHVEDPEVKRKQMKADAKHQNAVQKQEQRNKIGGRNIEAAGGGGYGGGFSQDTLKNARANLKHVK
jgi:hypothetical protein